MKNFHENIDTKALEQTSINRFFQRSSSSESALQRAWRWLSRYSLLGVVGLAALSITILHFQGKSLLQAMLATPLPIFWLEGLQNPEPLPDKTEVYTASLAKEANRQRSAPVAPPSWASQYITDKKIDTAIAEATLKDTTQTVHSPKKKRVRSTRSTKKKVNTNAMPSQSKPAPASLFQTVRVDIASSPRQFISCVVHSDQELRSQTRMALRLTEAMRVGDMLVPAGTLIYGMTRMVQNRLQVIISQIGQLSSQYQVYDHTYHEGIWLDRNNDRDPVTDIAQEHLIRECQRQVGKLPVPMVSQMSRSLLQRQRRNTTSMFLPDGYPVFIAPISLNP
ncbi:MAG: conjugative transposon protein TraM [Bacteroidota bacterium]